MKKSFVETFTTIEFSGPLKALNDAKGRAKKESCNFPPFSKNDKESGGYFKRTIQTLAYMIIRDELERAIGARKTIKGRRFDDDGIGEILDEGYKYASMGPSDLDGVKEKGNLEKLKSVDMSPKAYLPERIFVKEGFVSVYLKIDESRSKIREMTDVEADELIDEKSKMVDGSFVFNDLYADDSFSVPMSRNTLFGELKKSYCVAEIHYEYYVEINGEEGYFAYEFDDRDVPDENDDQDGSDNGGRDE